MEIIVDIIFYGIILCFAIALIQSQRMFHKFKKKYPDVANKIPGVKGNYRDPEKILYFFCKSNKQFLQNDLEIWKLRQQTKYFLLFSIGLSIITVLVVCSIILLRTV